ncbi:MAG: hypothetical protein AAFP92_30410 [Bacteroidota bacterium]
MSNQKSNPDPPDLVFLQNQLAQLKAENADLKQQLEREIDTRVFREAELEHLKRSVIISHGIETWRRFYVGDIAKHYIHQLYFLAGADPKNITLPPVPSSILHQK